LGRTQFRSFALVSASSDAAVRLVVLQRCDWRLVVDVNERKPFVAGTFDVNTIAPQNAVKLNVFIMLQLMKDEQSL
jgi:hypothetical protein